MSRRTISAALVVSLVCSSMPALAAPGLAEPSTSPDGFELRLGEALATTQFARSTLTAMTADEPQDLDSKPLLTPLRSDNQASRVALLPRGPMQVSWQSLQESTEPAPADPAMPAKKQGSWLKRHWYVPVLVAALIYVLAEGGEEAARGSVP